MEYGDTTIVLPTYNEAKNIGKLVSALLNEYEEINILVVDDGSKDRTSVVVKKIGKFYKNVKFFDRSKEKRPSGLTNSIVDGITMSETKYVIAMDADFQHPIEKIGEIRQSLAKGNKLVIAYREKVPGWALYRKIISKSLIYVAYLVLVLRGKERSKDIFSGYFGVEQKFFARIVASHKNSFVGEGYKVLFDLLKCIRKGSIKIQEVPYTFNVRSAGESKASSRQVIALFKSFIS